MVFLMPRTNIYISKSDYEIWLKAKALIDKINKEKGTRLSLSLIIMRFLKEFVRRLEENPESYLSSNKIKVDIGSIEISTGTIEVKETPKYPKEVKLTHLLLKAKLDSWFKQLEFIKANASSHEFILKQLNRLKNEILKEVKTIKTAPENLADQIARILAEIQFMEKEIMETYQGYT